MSTPFTNFNAVRRFDSMMAIVKMVKKNLSGWEGRTMLVDKAGRKYVIQEKELEDGTIETKVFKIQKRQMRKFIPTELGGIGRTMGMTFKELQGRSDY